MKDKWKPTSSSQAPHVRLAKNDHIPAIIACLLWSSAFVGVKVALNYASPVFIAGIRFFISGLLVIPVVFMMKGNFRAILEHPLYVFKVAFFQTFLLYLFFFLGMQYVSAAVGAMVVGGSPLWTALTTHVLTRDDKMDRKKLVASLTGILGMILITLAGKAMGVFSVGELFGALILVGCGIISALGALFVKKRPPGINAVGLNSLQLLIGGSMLLALSFLFEGIPSIPSALPLYIALGWLSLLSAVAFTLWFLVVSRDHVRVSDISMWKFILPVGGAVLSWILLAEESPELLTVSGIIIISISLLMFFRK